MSGTVGPKIQGLDKMVLLLDAGNPRSGVSETMWKDLTLSGSFFTPTGVASLSSSLLGENDGYYHCSGSYMTDDHTPRTYLGLKSWTWAHWGNYMTYSNPGFSEIRTMNKSGFPNAYTNIDFSNTYFQLEGRDSTQAGTLVTNTISMTSVANRTYYHCVVFDRINGEARFYRDGVRIGTQTISGSATINSTEAFTFPASSNPARGKFFRGEIWMRALTDDEVWNNWQTFRARYKL